jgi:hypothetical protein
MHASMRRLRARARAYSLESEIKRLHELFTLGAPASDPL